MSKKVKLTKAQKIAYDGLLGYGIIKHRVFTDHVGSGHRSEKYYFPNDQKVGKRVIKSLSQKGLIKRTNPIQKLATAGKRELLIMYLYN